MGPVSVKHFQDSIDARLGSAADGSAKLVTGRACPVASRDPLALPEERLTQSQIGIWPSVVSGRFHLIALSECKDHERNQCY